MKTVEKMGVQGDVMFIRVAELPDGANPQQHEAGRVVVAHSETGHDHVAVADRIRLYGTSDPRVAYLVAESAYADIVHERGFDTHETLRLGAGVWQVRRQREAWPGMPSMSSARTVAD